MVFFATKTGKIFGPAEVAALKVSRGAMCLGFCVKMRARNWIK